MRDLHVEVDCLPLLLLGEPFIGRMRHVDRSRPEQKRFSPICQRGNVGRKGSDHGGESFNPLQSLKWNFQRHI